MKRACLSLWITALAANGACVPLVQDRITIGDLAAVQPQWSQAPAGEMVGYAPAIGLRRILDVAELRKLASKYGIAGVQETAICFERTGRVRQREEVEAVLQKLESGVRLIEYDRRPTPEGELEFRLQDLAGAYWRGRVRQPDGRSWPFWARVEITAEHPEVIAAADLPAGAPIRADQLTVRPFKGIARPGTLDSVDQAIGLVPRRALRRGDSLTSALLTSPKPIERGQLVKVLIDTGGSQVAVQAVAQSAGSVGESILLRNPETSRLYRGDITGAGMAAVRVEAGSK